MNTVNSFADPGTSMIRCNICIAQPGEWYGAQYQSTVDAVVIHVVQH